MRVFPFVLLAILALVPTACLAQKTGLYDAINQRDELAWKTALKIWTWAEPGYKETQSSALLAQWLKKDGFEVQLGVAGMPTAFTASFGSGSPVIGIIGEYDALPGLAQDAVPVRQTDQPGQYGHGCGYHLFGVASANAAIAIAQQMKAGSIKGTIRYYGCPAEEGGSAKVFMVLGGAFADCDAALHWHPGSKNSAGSRSSLARNAVKFRFRGKSAHAAGAPEQGRSALDAVELTNHAAQLLREHTPDLTRIHHVITAGGGAPNVIPDFAEVYYYVRHPQASVVRDLYRRLVLCARAGALATETQLTVDFQGGILEILPNNELARIVLNNLQEINDLQYTAQDVQFAARLQQTLVEPEPLESIQDVVDQSGTVGNGSTDVGDVSWVVPTAGFTTACFVPGTPGHSWQAVACGGTEIARRGMNLAARVLAASAWDLFQQPEILAVARNEHEQRISENAYQTLMEDGQKPPLNYRDAPQEGN